MPTEPSRPGEPSVTGEPPVPAEPAEPSSLALAADFPTPTREQWRELVAGVLAKSGIAADVDPEKALSYATYDGIEIHPLYTAEDAPELSGEPGAPPFVRGSRRDSDAAAGWDVCTRHVGPDAAKVNAAALEDLERGATSLWLAVGEAGVAVDDLPTALDGVLLDLAPIVLDAGAGVRDAASALLALVKQREIDPAELTGSLGADPIGSRARSGAEADLEVLLALSEQSKATKLRVAVADGTAFHDAGASDAQELGIGTAVGVAYLRTLVDGGVPIDEALALIGFRWAVTAEQFPSIAKLRAARRIWDRVAELSGASADRTGQHQHAVTSAAMLTRRDPWVNMLRTTIACFSAAVGGADSITVAPFDSAIGQSDTFARRIARNTQSVLHDESSLARVMDAGGGSWYIESLTDALAEAGWAVFSEIERHGGALASLDDGTIDALLAETREKRDDDIAHRRAPITGVSEFAFVDELPVEREPLPEAAGAGLLHSVRYSEDFEALRDRADAAPARPKVFLATIGPAAVHSGRSGFAANLFQAGGLECVTGPVEEFGESGTTVVCLCSSDKLYADEAASAAKQLRDAGAEYVWLAGKADVDGVDATIAVGCDALDVLRTTFETLGVQA